MWAFDNTYQKYICCYSDRAFFSNVKGDHKRGTYRTCHEIANLIGFLLININTRFDNIKFIDRLKEFPPQMANKYAPLIANVFLCCYDFQFMAKLHNNTLEPDLIDNGQGSLSHILAHEFKKSKVANLYY